MGTLNKVRRDASRHFRNKKKAYWKGKIEELETNSKINNIRDLYRGINDIKKGYQPRTRIVKDEKGDLVADSHSIMARWRNYFSQILNVHGVSEVRQAEIHTAEPLVPEPSAFEIELATEKLKCHKSPGIDQIPAELIKAGGRTIRFAIHKRIIAIWNKEELPQEWKETIIQGAAERTPRLGMGIASGGELVVVGSASSNSGVRADFSVHHGVVGKTSSLYC